MHALFPSRGSCMNAPRYFSFGSASNLVRIAVQEIKGSCSCGLFQLPFLGSVLAVSGIWTAIILERRPTIEQRRSRDSSRSDHQETSMDSHVIFKRLVTAKERTLVDKITLQAWLATIPFGRREFCMCNNDLEALILIRILMLLILETGRSTIACTCTYSAVWATSLHATANRSSQLYTQPSIRIVEFGYL